MTVNAPDEFDLRTTTRDLYLDRGQGYTLGHRFCLNRERTEFLSLTGWTGFHMSIDDANGSPVLWTPDLSDVTLSTVRWSATPELIGSLPDTSAWRCGGTDPNGVPQFFFAGQCFLRTV